MTRTFVILLIVAALLFIGFYFALLSYNRFMGGFIVADWGLAFAPFAAPLFRTLSIR